MSDRIKGKGREKVEERGRRETVAWLTIAGVAAIEERGQDPPRETEEWDPGRKGGSHRVCCWERGANCC